MAKPAPPPPATPRAATAPAQSAHPGRPKTTGRDLPPRLLRKTKRLASGAVWTGYYYQGRDDEGRRVQIPLGTDLTAAKRRWAEFSTRVCHEALDNLREYGSLAAPGFMRPEGIVVFHVAANTAFKQTLEKDGEPKSRA